MIHLYLFLSLILFSDVSIANKNGSDFSVDSTENINTEKLDKERIKKALCNSLSSGRRHKIAGAKISSSNNVYEGDGSTFRVAHQNVYLWPSLTDHEKDVIREAFYQISRRTCIRFTELDYKPWYHADRWMEEKPYVVIRKSKKFSGYSDNNIEGVNRRSLLYLTDSALNYKSMNKSRGIAIAQLLRFMGFREENLRPDANSYIQPKNRNAYDSDRRPHFSDEQLQWPFDPESVTIGFNLKNTHTLTIYCQARRNENIGAGQRAGLLTRFAVESVKIDRNMWDAVKLNSMYCPKRVEYADPRLGPCVLPRQRQRP